MFEGEHLRILLRSAPSHCFVQLHIWVKSLNVPPQTGEYGGAEGKAVAISKGLHLHQERKATCCTRWFCTRAPTTSLQNATSQACKVQNRAAVLGAPKSFHQLVHLVQHLYYCCSTLCFLNRKRFNAKTKLHQHHSVKLKSREVKKVIILPFDVKSIAAASISRLIEHQIWTRISCESMLLSWNMAVFKSPLSLTAIFPIYRQYLAVICKKKEVGSF